MGDQDQRTYSPPPPARGPVVTPVDWSAGDRQIAAYFWTSTDKDAQAWDCSEAQVSRVLTFGMGARPVVHGTPFGHGHLTVHVDRVPLFVVGQLIRHRVHHMSGELDWLPNVSQKSYRYVTAGGTAGADAGLHEVFHLPTPDELRHQEGSAGAYTYTPLEGAGWLAGRIEEEACRAWSLYWQAIEHGLAPEQARIVLPQSARTRLYITASYRNWLTWLVQRNDPHAQAETRQVAEQVEAIIRACIPLTYQLWLSHGRRTLSARPGLVSGYDDDQAVSTVSASGSGRDDRCPFDTRWKPERHRGHRGHRGHPRAPQGTGTPGDAGGRGTAHLGGCAVEHGPGRASPRQPRVSRGGTVWTAHHRPGRAGQLPWGPSPSGAPPGIQGEPHDGATGGVRGSGEGLAGDSGTIWVGVWDADDPWSGSPTR